MVNVFGSVPKSKSDLSLQNDFYFGRICGRGNPYYGSNAVRHAQSNARAGRANNLQAAKPILNLKPRKEG